MHLRACPIFCNDFILCLIVFCRQLHTFAFFCFYARCCQYHFRNLSDFLCTHFPFCCFCKRFIIFALLPAFSFASLQLYLVFFFARFSACFFGCVNQRVTSICTCSFSFFRRALFVFFFALAYNQLYRTANPLLCHYSPAVSSLTPSTILVNYVLFSCP